MTTQGKGPDPHAVPSAIDLHNNNLRLIRMRWVAGAVMLFATLFSVAVLNVPLPTVALVILSLVVLAYNAAIWAITRRAGEMWLHAIATAQVAFDWLALALFVHFTGGVESPAIPFFLFHLSWPRSCWKSVHTFMPRSSSAWWLPSPRWSARLAAALHHHPRAAA
jgi:hypothetical protein